MSKSAQKEKSEVASKKKTREEKRTIGFINGEGEVIAFATGATTIRAGGGAFLPIFGGEHPPTRSSKVVARPDKGADNAQAIARGRAVKAPW